MAEWKDLTYEEKLSVCESSIDRTKINKNNKFNSFLNEVQGFTERLEVISAELYTREEATEKLLHSVGDIYDKNDVKFSFVKMGYCEDFGYRVRMLDSYVNLDKLCNYYKPVYYIEI